MSKSRAPTLTTGLARECNAAISGSWLRSSRRLRYTDDGGGANNRVAMIRDVGERLFDIHANKPVTRSEGVLRRSAYFRKCPVADRQCREIRAAWDGKIFFRVADTTVDIDVHFRLPLPVLLSRSPRMKQGDWYGFQR